LQEPDDQL